MSSRTLLKFTAPPAKSKQLVSLRKKNPTPTARTTIIAPKQAISVAAAPTSLATVPDKFPQEEFLTHVPKTGKDKGPQVVDLSDVPVGKRARTFVVRSWADAINIGRSDPVTASDYLYNLVPTGFETQDMFPRKLGEESIWSILTISTPSQQFCIVFFYTHSNLFTLCS